MKKKTIFFSLIILILLGLCAYIILQKVNFETEKNSVAIEINLDESLKDNQYIKIANESEKVQSLFKNTKEDINISIEDFSSVVRVLYETKDGTYLYGVDVSKNTLEITEEGPID